MKKAEDKLTIYLRSLGSIIKAFRKEKELTLEDLGYLIGLDPASIHNMEKGRNLTVITLVKLSLALNKEPKDFLSIPFKFSNNELDGFLKYKPSIKRKRKKTRIKSKK